ncbi:branched-chain alpha-keto acid dehydrogenase subunit E2 [Ureibacillus massiliensis 4400831 = CIP 108448 = CCUG 49529]|uniref:Dihydrolipoamide acetyltransferase component of pyruvate dehydrogenase complex n=1 Tax=Ureibacillus massiliensis 4400831 = CIP 108448 = CCUG 49529 TaxID=1211035 RepID=A0A0A3J352_9BACL|nr:dihydrolipoamide acetyltransferase family protein [Ureibacillus massiliensis]KGR91459.1 branched-chain alpha-keto acid dehydrogenase subunit E2 [Ureibacillus massiliensis 4400831 = CIP 108448 = CCUG 49529]
MTIENILMPQLGESVTEGTIEKWLVKPGDLVNKYDPIAEVVTDKVNAEIPSSFTGIIHELIAIEGETLSVGTVVCTMLVEGEKPSEKKDSIEKAPAKKINKNEFSPTQHNSNKARFSPAVLKLANEYQINLEKIVGTGLDGRITRKDIMKIVETGNLNDYVIGNDENREPAIKQSNVLNEEMPLTTVHQSIKSNANDIEIPVSSIRRAIANNMVRSKHEIPHAWMMVEADVTDLVQYRDKIKNEFKAKEGFNLTYFAFFIKAVATALKEFPMMNSVWAGDKIIQKKDIHISIAVATEDSLFVPVIKNADDKSIKGIAKEIYELSTIVRSGKLRAEHVEGGTFTVNNTGSFGSVQSMGIINYPQAAILQVESIVKRPVIMNGGMFAARDMVNLCLSIDHRILDGLICGKFLNRVKNILENAEKEQMSVY